MYEEKRDKIFLIPARPILFIMVVGRREGEKRSQ